MPFFFSYRGMRKNANTWWQSLLLARFLAPLDVDINVIRISPFLVEISALFPETAFVETLAIGQFLGEANNILDLPAQGSSLWSAASATTRG